MYKLKQINFAKKKIKKNKSKDNTNYTISCREPMVGENW